MLNGQLKTYGPAFISNAAANIITPPASPIYLVIKQIHVANVTNAAHTYSLYKGATGGSAAGTELVKDHSVAANKEHDIFFSPGKKFNPTEFLSGVADAASALVITVDAEMVVEGS